VTDISYEISRELRKYRRRHRLSVVQIADLLGVGRQHIHRIENGQNMPSIDLVERIADLVGIDIEFVRKNGKRKKPA